MNENDFIDELIKENKDKPFLQDEEVFDLDGKMTEEEKQEYRLDQQDHPDEDFEKLYDGTGQVDMGIKEKLVINIQTMYDVIFYLVRNGAVLTGSRAFGTEKESSDWDFFVDESFTFPLGFEVEGETIYQDKNTTKVYKHKLYKIHVQVSKDMLAKLKAQNLLLKMPRFIFRDLQKPDARRLWDWAFTQII